MAYIDVQCLSLQSQPLGLWDLFYLKVISQIFFTFLNNIFMIRVYWQGSLTMDWDHWTWLMTSQTGPGSGAVSRFSPQYPMITKLSTLTSSLTLVSRALLRSSVRMVQVTTTEKNILLQFSKYSEILKIPSLFLLWSVWSYNSVIPLSDEILRYFPEEYNWSRSWNVQLWWEMNLILWKCNLCWYTRVPFYI